MNVTEIIKNIIADGIDQCKEPIWERLLLPDFDEENPQSSHSHFSTAEEWLDAELHKISIVNYYLEKEYYATKPLMTEAEYSSAKLSDNYKRYAPDYFEFKNRWVKDHQKITNIEINRNKIKQLLDKDYVNRSIFKSLDLSSDDFSIVGMLGDIDPMDYAKASDLERAYYTYSQIWNKSRTKEGKQNVLYELERKWYFNFHRDFNYDLVIKDRQLIQELKLNYIALWKQILSDNENLCQEWKENRMNHRIKQEERKSEIDNIRIKYLRADTNSIITLCKEILDCSYYNFEFDKNIEIEFNQETKLLLVEYTLPTLENLLVSKSELSRLFDEAVYAITLRSIYEILINDTAKTINAINFNGWIKSINKATGKRENNCIVSIQVQHNNFMDVELSSVEPKSCFKFFKGVGSSKLYGITAIQPILQIQKNDKRFVNTRDVEFDNSTNLALMDWEDFEHLIRELFEKEFGSNGGEVKVTQASRDGGVDAIAFDPDPIRGGKIVIQAKRYTNTVGVSAVRDLFGTVMNEGANKGILVTTSDYGPDSYEFAKGKPITLLNGANLLYLLEKHGTQARIDIKEARRIMDENK